MTFLNFSQLPESVFRPNFPGKHFPENQAKFFFDWKMFSVDHFSNGKQTQKSLESGFPETIFRKTNTAKGKILSWKLNKIFLWPESVFRWPESVLRWLESVLRWPESVLRWPTFLMTNKHRKVWKVVSRKVNSGKQTWPRKWIPGKVNSWKTLSSVW